MKEICPGLYCGRTMSSNGSLSECGACPRGYRINENRECLLCVNDPSSYDLLYLGFMFMLPLIMHSYFINNCCENLKQQITLLGSAVLELLLSAIASILLMEPAGSFRLHTCGVQYFSDWYTLFYNPSPNYQSKLHCTQEAVYPLQTIVLIFYFICLLQMIFIRYFLYNVVGIHKKYAAYSALYFFPLLMSLHSMTCGLICFKYLFKSNKNLKQSLSSIPIQRTSITAEVVFTICFVDYGFPYLSIVISMFTNAWHQSLRSDRSTQSILKACVSETKNILIIGGHWFLLAYGIISLKHHYAFLVLVPLPLLFYILTLPFTDPSEFVECEERGC